MRADSSVVGCAGHAGAHPGRRRRGVDLVLAGAVGRHQQGNPAAQGHPRHQLRPQVAAAHGDHRLPALPDPARPHHRDRGLAKQAATALHRLRGEAHALRVGHHVLRLGALPGRAGPVARGGWGARQGAAHTGPASAAARARPVAGAHAAPPAQPRARPPALPPDQELVLRVLAPEGW